ncbi:MAG: DUF3800 domain-containing protein [Candidatus Spyradosoma sp.]
MYLFYLDESGTAEIPGNSPTFTLAAVGIPVGSWTRFDKQIRQLKTSYGIADKEIHVAWMAREYPEQEAIPGFESMSWPDRVAAVDRARAAAVSKRRSAGKDVKQLKKNNEHTQDYVHLSLAERRRFLMDLACMVGKWKAARLFAEVIDKNGYKPPKPVLTPMTQAFEQVVVRVESYLSSMSKNKKKRGLLIYDNNPSVADQLTRNMKKFYREGTFLSGVDHLIETPLFVSSELTGMIQIADLCAFALRRAIEKGDSTLLNPLLPIVDRKKGKIVGVRHYAAGECSCLFCASRRATRR